VERYLALGWQTAFCDRFGIDHFNPLADRIRTLAAIRRSRMRIRTIS
jgi:hypothetical protein